MRFNLEPAKKEVGIWQRTFVWLPHITHDGKHLVWLEWCETKVIPAKFGYMDVYRLWDGVEKEPDEHSII